MQSARAHRRLVSWMAILAILMASVMPALAHALSSADAPPWSEVCSAQRSTTSQDDEAASGSQAQVVHLFAHCPCCVGHAPVLGLPPAADFSVLRLDLKDEFPTAFLAAPRTLHAWVSAQPRAPPLRS
ncbi:DUF2946 domain-containing protein [Ideonella sp. DXS29W]|uniref:DUF2946 domain-containing protein n=1 Tax=Ideonella lacteola TaxID=2984193 RepID=A0ABU9BSF7_9BURK